MDRENRVRSLGLRVPDPILPPIFSPFVVLFQGAIPVAVLYVNREHTDAVAFGVVDDRGRRIKAHGLGVEKRTGKGRRAMTLEPGRSIGDISKACGVAFRETVFTEPSDLFEDLRGEGFGDTFGFATRTENESVPSPFGRELG